MSKVVHTLNLCAQCAESLIGFVVVRLNQIEIAGKCANCRKKKPVSTYRIMSERSGKRID